MLKLSFNICQSFFPSNNWNLLKGYKTQVLVSLVYLNVLCIIQKISKALFHLHVQHNGQSSFFFSFLNKCVQKISSSCMALVINCFNELYKLFMMATISSISSCCMDLKRRKMCIFIYELTKTKNLCPTLKNQELFQSPKLCQAVLQISLVTEHD